MKITCPDCGEVLIDLSTDDTSIVLDPIAFELVKDSWRAGFYGSVDIVCDLILGVIKTTRNITRIEMSEKEDDPLFDKKLELFNSVMDRIIELIEGFKDPDEIKQSLTKYEYNAKKHFEQVITKGE